MKKLLLSLLVLVVTTATAFTQTASTQGQINQVGPDGKRQGYWKLTAALLKLGSPWTPQQIVEEGNYVNSLKTGMWINYYSNGNKQSELTYVNNRPNGPAKKYFESGKLQEEGTWVGTRWTGPYKLYYENGNLRQQFNYNALGLRDGEQDYYHPNGKLAIKVTVKNGKEEGWMKEFNTNGELITETYYNGGVLDPSKTIHHDPTKPENANAGIAPEELGNKEPAPTVKPGDGNEVNIGTFTGDGPWTLYNKDKQVTLKGEFKNWKLIEGEERLYDNNGKLIRIKRYENGKYAGDGPLPIENNSK